MKIKKVLIITYDFPPRPTVGSLRLKGLAKYLPEFKWEPTILTATLPSMPDKKFRVIETQYPGDATEILIKKIHLQSNKEFQKRVKILLSMRDNAFTNKIIYFIKGFLAYPDNQKYWYNSAIKKGGDILSKEKFDIILSSSAPVTSHLIAKKLKTKYNLPWIADLRDLWTQNHHYSYGILRKWFEKRLEIHTLLYADGLVTVSKPLSETLKTLHIKKSIFIILNGFDPDDVNVNINMVVPLTKKFTITYTGALYQGKRDPELLLKAIRELIDENIIKSGNIRINFFGPTQYWLTQEIKKHRLEEVVKQYGTVPREIALKKQRESQILLLLNWNNTREQGVYTSKLFEYLAAKRPILAIGGPKGVVSELLEKTCTGIHLSSDLIILKKILMKYYKEYKMYGEASYFGKKKEIEKYSQYTMAKKFAKVLNKYINI